jgi:hypothetical protein
MTQRGPLLLSPAEQRQIAVDLNDRLLQEFRVEPDFQGRRDPRGASLFEPVDLTTQFLSLFSLCRNLLASNLEVLRCEGYQLRWIAQQAAHF